MAIEKTFRILCHVILFSGMIFICPAASVAGENFVAAENYCMRCHAPHPGLNYQNDPCMSCHEAVPMGHMGLYPWYSSEAAIAGIRCRDCHNDECLGNSCLSCHTRHSDPNR